MQSLLGQRYSLNSCSERGATGAQQAIFCPTVKRGKLDASQLPLGLSLLYVRVRFSSLYLTWTWHLCGFFVHPRRSSRTVARSGKRAKSSSGRSRAAVADAG
eukprot:TRINITY_DN5833_c0_g1_i2.p3 TRINITY_DN5833_c0_g1~~TRINITY_DN5833_c0_g1_i2.p3  ORF type:complete len:102 (-),score=1.52 TRINITY_DN5833_c0_g1_i2:207-512(-)